jgi:hypothetical protein
MGIAWSVMPGPASNMHPTSSNTSSSFLLAPLCTVQYSLTLNSVMMNNDPVECRQLVSIVSNFARRSATLP